MNIDMRYINKFCTHEGGRTARINIERFRVRGLKDLFNVFSSASIVVSSAFCYRPFTSCISIGL